MAQGKPYSSSWLNGGFGNIKVERRGFMSFKILVLLSLLTFSPSAFADWDRHGGDAAGHAFRGHEGHEFHERDRSRGSFLDFDVWPSYYPYGYPYAYPYYYAPGYTDYYSGGYQPQVIDQGTYMNSQAVAGQSQPGPQVEEAQPPSGPQVNEVTVNVPNSQGGFTPVAIKRSGQGYVGPQGEYYDHFPSVSELKMIYGK
jgi:hypothetical protein